MSAHIPVVEKRLNLDCFYGECSHDGGECPPAENVVTCEACFNKAEVDAEGLVTLPEWPCLHATHYPNTKEIISRLLEAHRPVQRKMTMQDFLTAAKEHGLPNDEERYAQMGADRG